MLKIQGRVVAFGWDDFDLFVGKQMNGEIKCINHQSSIKVEQIAQKDFLIFTFRDSISHGYYF